MQLRGSSTQYLGLSCVMLAVVEHHRWGSTLSPKFFLEKRFVVKHVRTKHAERLAEEQSKVGGGFDQHNDDDGGG